MTTFSWKDADAAVKRVRMYVETIVLVGGVTAAVCTLMARTITASMKSDVQMLRTELRQRAVADSVRFNQLTSDVSDIRSVVELVAASAAEAPGSDEQHSAVVELRRRRHVTQ